MSPQAKFQLSLPVTSVDHRLGDSHARVTLVEYGDYECPNCKQAAPAVKIVLKKYSGEAAFVYRHYPLEEVHPHALLAAESAEAAAGQGKFWAMHDLLFAHQSHLKAHDLRRYAQMLELDMVRYDAEIAENIYLQRIREHEESARRSGARGTPTFFLNGKLLDVSFGLQALETRIEAALKE
jgi:protein-disulfide isomerase